MSRIPRPFPLVTPNELISSSTLSRIPSGSPSMSSVTSATGLLRQPQIRPYSPPTGRPPSRSPSVHSQASATARTMPKRLFVANADAAPVPEDTFIRAHREQQVRRGGSYGAMGSPAHPRPTDLISFSPAPSVHSRHGSLSTPRRIATSPSSAGTFGRRPSAAASVTPRQMEEGNARAPRGPLLLGANPFMDSPSRNASPESFHSGFSMSSAPTHSSSGSSYTPFSRTYGSYLSPYASYSSNGSLVGVPSQLQPGAEPYPAFTNPFMPPMRDSKASNVSYPGTPLGTPAALTPSNASVHSLVPSVHLLDTHPSTQPQYNPQFGIVPANSLSAPPTAHIRAPSDDLLWRPYSAGARMSRSPNDPLYEDVKLPNPYGGEIRRFGSVPHVRSGSYSDGYGAAGYGSFSVRGAPYVGQGQGIPIRGEGIARGAVVAHWVPSWREMVMRAASG
ncbi:hypothetical protein BD310DRAFT_392901 [Dichomitus squalens]|uniref:Uncharacterized protein n=1 Tax=Dichomitus squalens TaxID=114155 RepID=A0A4Q9Q9W2_9APHY|nr:hypothetical protein BD310DRAFT_392901 [Dichomitus squalens]